MKSHIVVAVQSGSTSATWRPTTLAKLDLPESFLERAIVDNPDLLGLTSRRTGIYSPFIPFPQLTLQTPQGRAVHPDVTFLSASGHVIVVEVKRANNPELRDRRVIAQILDYTSSFTSLTEDRCLALFDRGGHRDWAACIESMFPNDRNAPELAQTLLARIRAGEINLVIACDGIPPGLLELVHGISSQKFLPFDLDVVEIIPFARSSGSENDLLLVPSTRLQTEIVSRTAITVTERVGKTQYDVEIEATPIEDVEANLAEIRSGRAGERQVWSPSAVESEIAQVEDSDGTQRIVALFMKHAATRPLPSGRRLRPEVRFTILASRPGDRPRKRTIFSIQVGESVVSAQLGILQELLSSTLMQELDRKIADVTGRTVPANGEMAIPLARLVAHLDEFEALLIWIKQVASHPSGDADGSED